MSYTRGARSSRPVRYGVTTAGKRRTARLSRLIRPSGIKRFRFRESIASQSTPFARAWSQQRPPRILHRLTSCSAPSPKSCRNRLCFHLFSGRREVQLRYFLSTNLSTINSGLIASNILAPKAWQHRHSSIRSWKLISKQVSKSWHLVDRRRKDRKKTPKRRLIVLPTLLKGKLSSAAVVMVTHQRPMMLNGSSINGNEPLPPVIDSKPILLSSSSSIGVSGHFSRLDSCATHLYREFSFSNKHAHAAAVVFSTTKL